MMKKQQKAMRCFVIGEEKQEKVEYCDFGIIETPIQKNQTAIVKQTNETPVSLGNVISNMTKKGIIIVQR